MKHKIGNETMIYCDEKTEALEEGMAELIENLGIIEGGYEFWLVRFVDDGTVCPRKIKKSEKGIVW